MPSRRYPPPSSAPLPKSDAHLTGQQWVEEYLIRLTQVDLLRGNIREATEVLAVGKEGFLKSELVSHEERFEELQLVLARNAAGEEQWQQFDIVIDTTGTFGVPNHLGPGGLPAAGESSLNRDQLWAHQSPPLSFRLPNIESEHRDFFAGKHTLVLGTGYSAATNLSKLLKLQSEEGSTTITWAVRHSEATERDLIARFPDDALPRRDLLASEVNHLLPSNLPSDRHFCRRLNRFPVQPVRIITIRFRVNVTTAPPGATLTRSSTGVSRTFLAIQLLGRTRDFATGFCFVGTKTTIRLVHHHRIVQQLTINLGCNFRGIHLIGPHFFARLVINRKAYHDF